MEFGLSDAKQLASRSLAGLRPARNPSELDSAMEFGF